MITINQFARAAAELPQDLPMAITQASDGSHSIVVSDGRDREQNRTIMENFRAALTEKYGTDIAFSPAQEREVRESGLSPRITGEILRNARFRSQLMGRSTPSPSTIREAMSSPFVPIHGQTAAAYASPVSVAAPIDPELIPLVEVRKPEGDDHNTPISATATRIPEAIPAPPQASGLSLVRADAAIPSVKSEP